MPRRSTKTPEGHASCAVRDLLDVEHIFYIRTNSGTILLKGLNGKKRAIHLAPKGTADLLALVPYRDWFMPCWIETKSTTGNLRPDQIDFRDDVVARGHVYLVARGSDEVLDWLRHFRKLHSI